jgi:two-component system chemotaxis sensor kinase CheA
MIALSAASSPTDVERGRAAGFSDYIAKFDRDALLASLQHCLQPMLAR